jgi:hypothetical protein
MPTSTGQFLGMEDIYDFNEDIDRGWKNNLGIFALNRTKPGSA